MRGRSATSCAAWSARTSRSTIPTPTSPAIDAEAKAFLVARYGDFVLLEPPFRPSTWLLWLGPAAGLLSAGAWLALRARRRHTNIGEPLSDAERARLDRLLAEPGDR